MAKKTVFSGVINGEKFDNVVDYNARMNELLSQGVENISAASSTEIRSVDENVATSGYDVATSGYVTTCTADRCPGTSSAASIELPEYEDLSFYPYMEDDDPFYLDLLVTEDSYINSEALKEVDNVFSKCYNYITEALEDPDTDQETRKEYLEDIRDILNTINENYNKTHDAYVELDLKKQQLVEKFNAEMAEIDRDAEMLRAANSVIDVFTNFYKEVESSVVASINTYEKPKCSCDGDCTCENVKTSCEEVQPTTTYDFNSLLDRIFGADGLIRRK